MYKGTAQPGSLVAIYTGRLPKQPTMPAMPEAPRTGEKTKKAKEATAQSNLEVDMMVKALAGTQQVNAGILQ